jgi:transcriptional regulator with XRE-family HTH domain
MNENKAKRVAIASRLTIARTQAGLSQGQVAKMLRLHRPAISEAEAGRRRVSAEELAQLAKIYGVSVDWLACYDTDKPDKSEDTIALAARKLSNLKKQDFDKVMQLLSAIKGSGKSK